MFFLGWVNDLDSFYGALDINTLSSVSEAFPYALPEGARAHLATVASNVGGVPAIIEHGVTGLLIEPGDVRMLAAYLARYALDENYRREMGEALYRRGKADFSEEATGLRQLEIYHAVFRMERNRRDGVRDGVLICGAYGFGNTGDDAILQAIIGEMRRIDPHMPVTVLSRRPKDTRSACGVNACHRFHLFAIRRILRRSLLFISGGGSLMQDVTSRLSLWYYLGTIRMAHRCGCKVQMYGCGIGPIVYERDRQLAARIINDCVDKITLREPDSRETLSDFGVTDPEVILASDPALTLPAAERSRIDRILREHDMDPDGKYIGFVLRKWPGIEEKGHRVRRRRCVRLPEIRPDAGVPQHQFPHRRRGQPARHGAFEHPVLYDRRADVHRRGHRRALAHDDGRVHAAARTDFCRRTGRAAHRRCL